MTDLIYLQTGPETIVVGSGVLTFSAQPLDGQPSFYSNDFFLESETPWVRATTFEELSITQFKERYLKGAPREGSVTWKECDEEKFRKFFQKIKSSIERGLLEKIVPVLFETGVIPEIWDGAVIEAFTARFIKYLSSGLYLFGFQKGDAGFCGLTPELLFEQRGTTVTTAALAGTKASQFGDRSIKNPKDVREHQIVVDDIKTQLSTFGKVSIGETVPYWNGSLIHLRASIIAECETSPHFAELVTAIHPTAAVGVYPRTANAKAILKGSDAKIARGFFAAPFGISYPDARGLCVASIRTVFWNGSTIRLGAGCGVIEESDLELELKELELKRKSIKEKLG